MGIISTLDVTVKKQINRIYNIIKELTVRPTNKPVDCKFDAQEGDGQIQNYLFECQRNP